MSFVVDRTAKPALIIGTTKLRSAQTPARLPEKAL